MSAKSSHHILDTDEKPSQSEDAACLLIFVGIVMFFVFAYGSSGQ